MTSWLPVRTGRYLAEHIPGARYAEIPGTDHFVVDPETQDIIADGIEEFITGEQRRLEPDRVLATVMFTDIVASTQRVAELGDGRWRELRGSWHATMRKELTAFRGREVDTAGDGLLATFDGPARAIRCACSVRERVHALGLQVRTGLHTGECERVGDGVVGIAVHIGARVAAMADPDEVLVSSTVRGPGRGLRSPVRRSRHAPFEGRARRLAPVRRPGGRVAIDRGKPQPLTEPAVRPCTMYFWKISTSSTAGSAPRKPEAAITE